MKPSLINIYAFDATYDKEIHFTWFGKQIFGIEVTIENNETSENVLTAYYDIMKTSFTLPGGTLTNGIPYTMSIKVKDANNEYSESSDKILFYCFTTPTWKFKNIAEKDNVENAMIVPELYYSQPEGEILSEYNILLYDVNHQLLYQTGALYDEKLSATIRNLMNDTIYYIRSTGNTLHGMEVDTGFVQIYVRYILPNFYSAVYAENFPNHGYIKLSSNITVIDYEPHDGFIFIDNKYIDLRNMYIKYTDGFTLPKTFSCTFIVKDFKCFESVLELIDRNESLIITPIKLNGKIMFELKDFKYTIYSNLIPETNDFVKVFLKKDQGVFDILIKEVA